MKPLNQLISNLFDIKKKELSIALWMQLYLFLIIGALLVVKPTINALFLSTAGADSLSIAFILTAIIAVVISFSYHKLLERFNLRYIIRSTLWFFSIAFFAIGLLVMFDVTNLILVYTFYLFVGIYALLVTSQFWVLANVIFNIREAKRLFGFIGAGGIAGGIAGGYVTSILVPFLGNGALIIVASLMIASCPYIYHKIKSHSYKGKMKLEVKKREVVSKESSIKLIINSRHLTHLAGVIGIGVLVAKLVDYEFSYLASQQIQDPMELASFFGFWFSTFNIISLILQLLITKRLLENFNIETNLFFLPAAVIASALLLFVMPELWLVIILKGFDGSLKQSLHKSVLELLAIPIPSDIKNKTKTFIDVVVDSIATGLAGLVIIFVVKGLNLPNYIITVSIAILSIIWIYLIFKVKDSYLSIFKQSIVKREKLRREKNNMGTLISNMKIIFENGGAEDVLAMLQKLPEISHKSLKEPILKLLNHNDKRVVTAVINNLDYVVVEPVAQVQDFIYTNDSELINAAMNYLLSHEHISYQFYENYLDDEDDKIATAALLSLAAVSQENPLLAEKYNLKLRIQIFSSEIGDSNMQIAELARLIETLGYASTTNYYSIIENYLNHDNKNLRIAAIKAVGHTRDTYFLMSLIEGLRDDVLNDSITVSIQKMGNKSLKTLEQVYLKQKTGNRFKVSLLHLLYQIETRKSHRLLIHLAKQSDISVKKIAFELLFKSRKAGRKSILKKKELIKLIDKESAKYKELVRIYWSLKISQRSDKRTNGVISLLEKNLIEQLITSVDHCISNQLEIIFNLLSQRYNPEDVYVAYKGMTSKETVSRLHSMEYLNGILSRDLKNMLFPLFELESHTLSNETFEFQERIELYDRSKMLEKLLLIQESKVHSTSINLLHLQHEKLIDTILSHLPTSKSLKIKKTLLSLQNGKVKIA
ncbi:hypothetical protein FNJ87_04985 [Nonlabens mediterrranea]|uniref:ADP,ATP carrier protein n=1 Tax=Nonlabens mediterrranea TaxID=1419947 RepID=A0ABS0A517_9FLAO|nr:hypothetical protein [Nonlabens mediterrranea]